MATDQKRAFFAVLLSGLVLVLWQFYFSPKPVVPNISTNIQVTKDSSERAIESAPSAALSAEIAQKEIPNSILTAINEGAAISLDQSLGIHDFSSEEAIYPFSETTGLTNAVTLFVRNQAGALAPIKFALNQGGQAGSIEGLSSEGAKFFGQLHEDGVMDYQIIFPAPTLLSLAFASTEKSMAGNHYRDYVWFAKKPNRWTVGNSESSEGQISWAGVDFNHHVFVWVFEEKPVVKMEATEGGRFTANFVNPVTTLSGKLVFAKKNYDRLTTLGHNLDQSVDFGIFGIIAVPMLRALQFFYAFFPNYGIAIILLTVLIRLLTFPLQFKSFKSMKKMQLIQPELVKLKEKFKDDPQRMQRETMEMFKKNGANPLGGCLPMLAQMPVFIAFYAVLSNAVELVGAPFALWIHDLSLRDPYFILPIVMGVAMLGQTKLNPTPTADPAQKKIMMIMPIVFTFFMKDLPAGLNLYMTVSIVLGIGQQLLVYKLSD